MATEPATEVQIALAIASAAETARITATLIRVTGDWSMAEDCVQDAFTRASDRQHCCPRGLGRRRGDYQSEFCSAGLRFFNDGGVSIGQRDPKLRM